MHLLYKYFSFFRDFIYVEFYREELYVLLTLDTNDRLPNDI